MAKVLPQDQQFLEVMVEWQVLEPAEAEDYLQSFALHAARDPELTMADFLIDKGVVHTDDAQAALDEVASRAPRRPAARSSAHRGTRSRGRPSPARSRRAAPMVARRSDPTPIIIMSVVAIAVLGAVIWFIQKPGGDDPSPNTEVAREEVPSIEEPAVSEDLDPGPSLPAVTKSDESDRKRRKFSELQAISDPQERLEQLDDFMFEVSGKLEQEVAAAVLSTRDELDRVAKSALRRQEGKIERYLDKEDYAGALAILDQLLREYGSNALNGEIEERRSAVHKQLDKFYRELVDEGVLAYEQGNYSEAKRCFDMIAESGLPDRVKTAKYWLPKVRRKLGSGREVAARPEKSSGKTREASVGKRERDRDRKPDTPREEPRKEGRSATDEIAAFRDKLDHVCPSGKATLSPTGLFVVEYNFMQKNTMDGEDWSPAVNDPSPDFRDRIRWTLRQEEVVVGGMVGVRVSDRGVWRHNVKLKAPISLDLRYFPTNQYRASNILALAWFDEKGKGVATNMGLQTGLVKGGRFTGAKGSLFEISCLQSYRIRLNVTESSFSGNHDRSPTPSRKVPKKMTSGFAGILFANEIAGTLQSIRISGKLDLEWARKNLK